MNASKRVIGSDLARVDAYVLTEADCAEIPELTDEDFARGVVVRAGFVSGEAGNAFVRLDADTVEIYRALGNGWEAILNADLRGTAKRRRAE